ncbi:MAG: dockerin type I domain-containing protein [Phycisphaerales bacterium]
MATTSVSANEIANFARSTFDLSEWTREAHTKPLNGSEGGAVFILNGTNPWTGGCLEFRWFTPVPSVIYGIAFLNEATWDPAADGEILTVSIGMAAVQLDPNHTTVQQGRFFLEQGGHYYEYSFSPSGIDNVELYFEAGLDATDFREVFFNSDQPSDPNSNPDFSENGAPIRFGFGQGFAFFDGLVNTNIKTGIDNFSLQIVHELPVVPPACPADFNGDGFINLPDLNVLLANFGQQVEPGTNGDVTGDGEVNLLDLNRLLAVFGTACPE